MDQGKIQDPGSVEVLITNLTSSEVRKLKNAFHKLVKEKYPHASISSVTLTSRTRQKSKRQPQKSEDAINVEG